MLSDLDQVILAMSNRDRQIVDGMKNENKAAECRASSTAPPIPRPKGARVRFTPPSSTSENE